MARGVELGVAYLSLAAETRGLVADIGKGLVQGEKLAGESGQRMGRAIKKGVESAQPIDTSALTQKVEEDQKKLAAVVEQTSRRQEDARAKVRIAEQRLMEVRDNSRSTTSQVMRAEEQLRQAVNRSKDATSQAEAKQKLYSDQLAKSKSDLESAESSNKKLADSVEATSRKYEGFGGAVRKAMDEARSAMKVSFNGVFDKAESDGRSAARGVAAGFEDSADESSKSFGSKFSGAFKGLVGAGAAAGAAVGASFIKGVTDNLQQGDIKARMAGSLNLSGSEAKSAGKVTGDLFKQGFGESYEGVAQATSAVISSIPNIAGNEEQLKQVTKNILAMSDAMGIEATESAGALTTMLSSGLAKDGVEATQILTAGLQKIPEQFRGEAIDAFTEYSDEFANMGYSGEEAMAMIVKGAQKGQYGIDKTGDSIKELSISATDGSKSTVGAFESIGLNAKDMSDKILAGGDSAKEARNQIVDALLGVKDPSAQAQAAIALFGTPLEDMNVSEIPQFLQGMKDASGGMGDFKGAAQNMTDQLQNSDMNKLEAFKRTMSQGWTEAVGGLVSALVNVVEFLSPVRQFLADTSGQWGPFAAGIGIVTGAVILWKGATLLLNAELWAQAAAMAAAYWPITAIIAAIGLLVGSVIYAYQNFEWFRNAVDFVWNWIKGVIAGFVGWWTQTAWPFIIQGLQWIGDKFVWLYQNVVLPVWGFITSVISGFVTWLTTVAIPWVSGALQTLGGWFSWLNTTIIQPVWYAIRVVITAAVAIIMTVLQGVWWLISNKIGPIFLWLWNSIINPVFTWIGQKIGAFGSWFSSIALPVITGSVNVLKIAFQWLWEKISAVFTWSWNKIQAFANWFATYILPFLRVALDGVKLAFQWLWDKISAVFTWSLNKIRSFANWFATYILPFIRDVLNQLKQNFQWLWEKVSAVWTWISDKISRAWRWIRDSVLAPAISWLKTVLGPAWQWLSDKIGRVWDWISDKIRRTWNWTRDNVLSPLMRFIEEDVVGAFTRAKDGIGRVWDKIKDKVKEPVRFVVDTVINGGFIKNYNKVADKFKVDKLPEVKLPSGFAMGGIVGQGYARGGILPGYQRKKKDELLTPMRKGEGVLVPEAVRALGADFIHGVNGAANSGGVRAAEAWKKKHGVAAGDGRDHGAPAGAYGWAGSSFKTAGATPPSGGSGIWGSFQAAASRAGAMSFPDKSFLGASTKRAAQAWMGRSALNVNTDGKGPAVSVGTGYAGPWGFNQGSSVQVNPSAPSNMILSILMHEFGHALSLDHTNNGASIMHPAIAGVKSPSGSDYAALRSAWGKPGEGVKTYDVNGGDGGFDFGAIVKEFFDATVGKVIDKGLDGFKSMFPGNHFVGIGVNAVKKMVDDALSFVTGNGDGADDGGGSSKDWTPTVKKALARAGLPVRDDYVGAWLRQIQSESGGNPRAMQHGYVDANTGGNEAAGLVQVALSTWNAYRDKSLPNDRFNPLASLMAGMNWAKFKYGTSGMLGAIGHGHGYARGGIVDHIRPTLFDGGGWLTQGTSVVQHNPKKPDAVLSNADWQTMYKIAEESGKRNQKLGNDITVVVPEREGVSPDVFGRRVAEGLAFELNKIGV